MGKRSPTDVLRGEVERRYERGRFTRCERCGRPAKWWVWVPGFQRHAICDPCTEPVVEALEHSALGKLKIERV